MIILLVASFLLWHRRIDDSLWELCLMASLAEMMVEAVIVMSYLDTVA